MSSSNPKKASVIRAAEAEEFNRWSMPEMSLAERERLIALAQRSKKPSLDLEPEPVEVVEEPLYAEKMTLAEWEQIREEAYQDGYNQGKTEGFEAGRTEGVEQGLKEGLLDAQVQIDAQLEQAKALIAGLQNPIAEQEEQLHQVVMSLVFKLARAMVEAELSSNPEPLKNTVKQALAMIPPAAGAPVISLHPEDCQLMRRLADREGWELRENPDANRGDLRLVAGSCVIELDLEQRFDQVAGELKNQILGQS